MAFSRKHVMLDIYDHNRSKICSLYDSKVSFLGQAYDIVLVEEQMGWKELSFNLPFIVDQHWNYRWDNIRSEYFVRLKIGSETDWFIIHAPKVSHSRKSITNTVNCSHLSSILKTKNLYMVFDDENGIDTAPNQLDKILKGTGWKRGVCDTFLESDGETEKIRSLSSNQKSGAYKLISTLCELFNAYPVFHGETRTVDLKSLNNRGALREMTIGKDIETLAVTYNSEDIITRLYVEGEYSDLGYVGIESENPTGLSYLLNFDYYKEIGIFTDKDQEALDQYLADIKRVNDELSAIQIELNGKENELNSLWGQINYVAYKLENGSIVDKAVGGVVSSEKQSIQTGDEVVLFNADGTYILAHIQDGSNPGFTPDNPYAIKYITKPSGLIGAKEVAIEAKQKMLENLSAKVIDDTETSPSTPLDQMQKLEDEIREIYEGSEDVVGLYAQTLQAVVLAFEIRDIENTRTEKLAEQEDIEATFVSQMGDLLKDGYWNNKNYTVGQEKFLYADSVEIMNEMSRPSVTYTVSRVSQAGQFGYEDEDIGLNFQVRVYDPQIRINDIVYASKMTTYLDNWKKNDVQITNESVTGRGLSQDSILSRMTQIADLVDQKNSLYERSEAINSDGSILMDRLNGQVNLLKNQLSSVTSSWYTDDRGNIIFESVNGRSAMMLCGEGFMIAYGKTASGEWNWRTFGNGEGFTADAIITGFLSGDRIEANTITANKLDSSAGSAIDLSKNGSISMLVTGLNTVTENLENKVEADWVEERISSELALTTESLTVTFTKQIENTSGQLNAFKSEIETYQRFSSEGLELGKSDSPFKALLSNEKLAFQQDGIEVAYISNNRMYITEANVTNKLSIGSQDGVCFEWRTTSAGMGLKWIGKEVS